MEARAELIKVDRNGSKHWRGRIECDRCSGHGYYAIGVRNGEPVLSPLDAGVCWKCGGDGWVIGEWIERTPEYQAKLDARREARRAAKQAEWDAAAAARAEAQAKAEAEREAKAARREAERLERAAISQHVGEIGQKISTTAEYIGSPCFERGAFSGFGTETCYIHSFLDASGNKLVWKTTKGLSLEEGQTVSLTGTVKDHSEYRDEKQTVLTRCRVQ